MRVFAYVNDALFQQLQTSLQGRTGYTLITPPPTDYIATATSEAGNIDIDDSDDLVIVDPTLSSGKNIATAVYAAYTRRIPVGVVGDESAALALPSHPLILKSLDTPEKVVSFITEWAPEKGVLVSFEGGDGAGKQTQTALMVKAIRDLGREVRTIDFPHDTAFCGKLIRKVLRGDCGSMKEVDPLLFASLYGMNRFDFGGIMRYWLRRGYVVVLDRYVEANFGHQASKLSADEDRHRLIKALGSYEHKWLGLPESHLVMYLDLPPEVAFRAMKGDTTRRELDMHEKAGIDYKERVRQTFLWCAKNFTKWRVVSSMEGEERRSRDTIHAECVQFVKAFLK